MNSIIRLAAALVLCAGFPFSGGLACAQGSLKQQLAGTWILLAINQTDKEGKPVYIFGPNPRGTQVFDVSGQWIRIVSNPDIAKFKINNRLKGTPEENTAAMHGTIASFGIWTVDEATKTLTITYNGGMYPNEAGTISKRVVSVTGDELRVSPIQLTGSGMTSSTVWRRAK